MKTSAIMGIGVLSLGMMAMPGVVRAQTTVQPDLPGPIDSLRDLQETGRMMFILADTNHDGQISQKEAINSNNLAVGGFFFTADRDGNGVVSPQELRAARDEYLNQNPWARYVVESIEAQAKQKNQQNSNQPNPLQSVMALLDANNDKQIQAAELRQLVQTTTQSFFAAADTNRDGQMSPSEVNAAVAGGVRALAQAAFQQADKDNNGGLSRDEFDKAIVEPANVAFQILDLNHDGQISPQEAQTVERTIINQVRMLNLPEPENSPRKLAESGKLPSEAAPVPTFANPNPNAGQPGAQPPAPR
jgi:Ca2+-binding EF-hand superfamily protein